LHRIRLLYFVLEFEKGPIHPPSWSIDPYRGARSGAHREAPRVCAQRAGVVQLRARPAAAAAASARQGRRLRWRLQLVEAGGADCSGACNSREAGARPAVARAACTCRGAACGGGCRRRVEGLWPARGGGSAGARGGGGVAAAVDSACRRNKARKRLADRRSETQSTSARPTCTLQS